MTKIKKKKALAEDNLDNSNNHSSSKIKLLYASTIGGVLLIVILIAIIVIFIGGNNNKDNVVPDEEQEEEEEDQDDYIYMNLTHYITAKYEVKPIENEWEGGGEGIIKLFKEKYLDSISSLLIDGQKVKILNEYFFNIGEHIQSLNLIKH